MLSATLLGREKARLIAAWRDESEEVERKGESFDAFFRLWMSFNAFLSAVTGEEGDGKMIRSIARNRAVRNAFATLRQTDDSFYEKSEHFASFWPVYSEQDTAARAPHLLTAFGIDARTLATQLDGYGVQKRPTDLNDHGWESTIWAIYQVRCNLFHGGKSPLHMRDLELVDAAYNILAAFIVGANLYA